MADLHARKLPLRPGVARLLDELRAERIPLAIASTCVKSAAIEVLQVALGEAFPDSLAAICAGDDVRRKKPHPDAHLLAAEQCGVAPENCLVLEDTAHGLQAALVAGMTCVATPSELALHDDSTGAPLLVESLDAPEVVTSAGLRALFR